MQILTLGDRKFLTKCLQFFDIKAVNIEFSDSKKVHPDIWITFDKIPKITVTKEWRSHNKDLRRSQLVHEFLHIRGLEHGEHGKYVYSAYPAKDTLSKKVYRDMVKVI